MKQQLKKQQQQQQQQKTQATNLHYSILKI